MILDQADEFTTAGGEAFTATAVASGNVFDVGENNTKDWGAGEPIYPYLRVTHDADCDVGTSVTLDIIAADSADLTSNPVVLSTKTILKAALTKDTLHKLPPLYAGTSKRYLGAKCTMTGGNATAGKFIIGFVDRTGRPQNGINYL